MQNYYAFLNQKKLDNNYRGFEPTSLNKHLFPFQRDIVKWAIRKGRACLFEDCGLGKTIQQLEWGQQVWKHTKKPVLIVAPLAVAEQTKKEGVKFGIPVNICMNQNDVVDGVNITNYEKLHKFIGSSFSGVVLDESSILKSYSGKIRSQIIDMFMSVPYKLACTATPSPNDYMELGNHAEFLGIMSYSEMLAMFFVNDSGHVSQWRLKRHAHEALFWEWLCSWAIMISKPSDLGYRQEGFDLPKLEYIECKLPAINKGKGLLVIEASTLTERRQVRKETIELRCKKAAELVNNSKDQWLLWCGLNKESEVLNRLIPDAVEISGSTEYELRKKYMFGFAEGKIRCLVTKPSIAGFGMNWQNCHKVIFVGLSDSWEQLYQAVRRVWRFGQKKQVQAYIIIEEREGAVLKNIRRKDKQARYMIKNMIKFTKDITVKNLREGNEESEAWEKKEMILPNWMN